MNQSVPGMSNSEYERRYLTCLIPKCKERQFDRGVCKAHFEGIQKQVDAREIVWKQYEDEGCARPPGTPPELIDKRRRKKPASNCMTENCDKKAAGRGLCMNCYQAAYRLIQQSKTTWKRLEEINVALPSTIDGTVTSRATNAINKAIESRGGFLKEVDRHIGRSAPATQEATPRPSDEPEEDQETVKERMREAMEKHQFQPPPIEESPPPIAPALKPSEPAPTDPTPLELYIGQPKSGLNWMNEGLDTSQ